MIKLRVADKKDKDISIDDCVYDSSSGKIYESTDKGMKRMNIKESVVFDELKQRIFLKEDEHWHPYSFKMKQVQCKDVGYKLSSSCTVKFSQLPVVGRVVDLSALMFNENKIVVSKHRDRVLIHNLIRERECTQYRYIEICNENYYRLKRDLKVCRSTPKAIYDRYTGVVDLNGLLPGSSYIVGTTDTVYIFTRTVFSFECPSVCINCQLQATQTITVGPSGNGDYATISHAINAASGTQNVRILVFPGQYSESLTIDGTATAEPSSNGLSIIAQTPDTVFLQVFNTKYGISISNIQCVFIIGITIIPQVSSRNGILILSASAIIANCAIISNSSSHFGTAVGMASSSGKIIDNKLLECPSGIHLNLCNDVIIENNIITGSNITPSGSTGIVLYKDDSNIIIKCNNISMFHSSDFSDSGIGALQCTGTQGIPVACIENNIITDCDYGITFVGASNCLIKKNVITNNNIYGTYCFNYVVNGNEVPSAGNIIIENDVHCNKITDIFDSTGGFFTAHTGNLYSNNSCGTDNVCGVICGNCCKA